MCSSGCFHCRHLTAPAPHPMHSVSTPNCLPFMVQELTLCFLTFIILYVIFLCKICCFSFSFPSKTKKNCLLLSRLDIILDPFGTFPFTVFLKLLTCHMLFISPMSIYFIIPCLPHNLQELSECRVTVSKFPEQPQHSSSGNWFKG